MSKFVDERVVEMSFDNKQFEKNVKTSMGTLDKLKNSLDFSGSASAINRELGSINVNALSAAMMSAKRSFTGLEVAAIAAIANISNRVVNLGIDMVKALSTDNISEGWSKFGQIAKSEATLLAQGFEQEKVTETLKELTWFADETSYSLTDMVDNMSKFTASGRSLDESANAMMGIANWAALAGQNSQKASVAMYQLSQALGRGSVRWQDWRSIVNANMDTKQMRSELLDMAVLQGELVRGTNGLYATTGSGKTFTADQFTDSLQYEWFTSDVLLATLNKYAEGANEIYRLMESDSEVNTATEAIKKYGDQIDDFALKAFLAAQEARTMKDMILAVQDAVSSGYMMMFNNMFGTVEEAKVFWTDLANELYNVFTAGIWRINDVLEGWSILGGRNDLFANTEETTGAFWNLFHAFVAIKDLIGNAWQDVFGLSDAKAYTDQIAEISNRVKGWTESFRIWTEGLFLNKEATTDLTNVFRGLFGIFKIIGRTIGAVYEGFRPLFDLFGELMGQSNLLSFFGDAGDSIADFANSASMFEVITASMQAFFKTIIKNVKDMQIYFDAISGGEERLDEFAQTILDRMHPAAKWAVGAIENIVEAFIWLKNTLVNDVWPIMVTVGQGFNWLGLQIVDLYHKSGALINQFINWVKTNETIQNGLTKTKDVLIDIGDAFKNAYLKVTEFFSSFDKDKTSNFGDSIDGIKEKFAPLESFVNGLTTLFQGLWAALQAVGRLVGNLFEAIGQAVEYLGNRLKAMFTNSSGDLDFMKLFKAGFWAAVAVGIYRFAEMLKSITDVFKEAFESIFDYFNSKAMEQYMQAIKTMAISILLMVGALVLLASMDTDSLNRSLAAMGILIAFIVSAMLLMKKLVVGANVLSASKAGIKFQGFNTDVAQLGVALIGLGVAILVMVGALKMLSNMTEDELTNGISRLAMLMGMIIVTIRLIARKDRDVNKAVKSMVKVAISITLLRRPLEKMGKMDSDIAEKGLTRLGILMGLLAGFSRFSGKMKSSQKPVTNMISLAIGLTLLLVPLNLIGRTPTAVLTKALITITLLFAIIIAVEKIMGKGLSKARVANMNTLVQALIPLGIGMSLMAISFLLMGSLPIDKIGKALLAMVGILGTLVVVNHVMGKKLTASRIRNMTNMVLIMVPLALGMSLMAMSFLAMGSLPIETIGKALGSMIVVFTSLVLMNKVLGQQLTKARITNLTLMIVSLIPLAYGMMLMAGSFLALGSLSGSVLQQGLLTMLALLSMLALANYAITASGGGATMVAMAGGIAAVAGALMLFNMVLITLGNLPLGVIITGLVTLIAIFAVLGISAAVLTPLIPIILLLAASILAIGVAVALLYGSMAFVLIGVGGLVLMIAMAFEKVVETVSKYGDEFGPALIKMSDSLVKAIPKIMKAIKTFMKEFAEVLGDSMPYLMDAFALFITEFLRIFGNMIPDIVDVIMELISALLVAVADVIGEVVSIIFDLILKVIDLLIEDVPTMVDRIITLVIRIIEVLTSRIGEVVSALYTFASTFVSHFASAMEQFWPMLVQLGYDTIIAIMDGIGDAIEENAEPLRAAVERFLDHVWMAFKTFFGINSPSTKMKEIATYLISGLVTGLTEGWDGLKADLEKWTGDVVTTISTGILDTITAGENIVANIKTGITNKWEEFTLWVSGKVAEVTTAFDTLKTSLKTSGENATTNLKTGFNNKWTTLTKWVDEKILWIKTQFTGLPAAFVTIGEDLINGFVEGMKSIDLGSIIDLVFGDLAPAVRFILDEHSPSRVFRDIGENVSKGFAIGVKSEADGVKSEVENMANDAIDGGSGLSGTLAKIYDMLTNEFDGEIVIKPVLDLSEIQNGKNLISGMLDESYGISGSNRYAGSVRDDINRKSSDNKSSTKAASDSQESVNSTINNTFNITGANPKEIAEEVSKVLQNQVDRRNAKWAL